MNEFINKLIERLEEEILTCQSAYTESIIGMCGKSADNFMREIHAYEKTKKIINQLAEEYKTECDSIRLDNGWISVEEKYPDSNDYILLSFSNFSIPVVGRWEEDEEGGAFYVGDEDKTCVSQDMFVNAWMPLPNAYRTEDSSYGE